MNKKGFTMVELLAVIAIIGVLAVAAIAGYNGMTDRSKQKAYEAKIALIETSAIKWAKENNIRVKTSISVNKLVVQGYLQADTVSDEGLATIKNPIDDSNMICKMVDITIKDNDVAAKYLKDSNNCSLATQAINDSAIIVTAYTSDDTEVLFSSGGNELDWTNKDVGIVVTGSTYMDRAKSITFDYNGETKTAEIPPKPKEDGAKRANEATNYSTITKDSFNALKMPLVDVIYNGEVAITFTMDDGSTKTRIINVRIDKEEPTASIQADQEWITTDRTVKVYIDDGNGSGANGYYIGTNEYIYDNDSFVPFTSANEKYMMMDELELGTHYLFPKDNAGNVATKAKTKIVVNNIDKSNPGCDISFDKTPNTYGWYKEFPRPIVTTHKAGVSGLYYGLNEVNAPSYTGDYVREGNIGVSYFTAPTIDTAGKTYYCFTKTAAGNTNSSNKTIKVDTTPPTLLISNDTRNTYSKEHEITVTIRDVMSGLGPNNNIKYGWSLSNTTAPGSWETLNLSGTISDNRGTTSNITGTITGKDMTGDYYLWIKSSTFEDIAGNVYVGDGTKGTPSDYVIGPFKFDNTPPEKPTVTLCKWATNDQASRPTTSCTGLDNYVANNWSERNIATFASGGTDTGGSGFKEYQLTTTGRTSNVTEEAATKRDVEAQGTSTVKWRACDKAGNCSDWVSNTINIDKKAPTIPTSVVRLNNSSGATRTASNEWTNETRWWGEFNASDANGGREVSGVDHYEYSSKCTGTKTKNLKESYTYSESKNYKFCIRAVDVAGNIGDWSDAYYFKIDKTAPDVPSVGLYNWKNNSTEPTSSSGLTAYTNNTWSKLSVTAFPSGGADSYGAGFKEYQYTTSGTTANKTEKAATKRNIKASGVSTIKWRSCDKAGNCSAWSSVYTIKLDKVNPTCTITKITTDWDTDGVDYKVTCSDEWSGVKECAGVSGTTATKYNAKSDTEIEVVDNSGRKGTCTLDITSQTEYRRKTRSWYSCATGDPYDCVGGYEYTTRSGVLSIQCDASCEYTGWQGQNYGDCTCSTWNSCKTTQNTCQGDWGSYSGWSDWSTSNSCSGYSEGSCTSESRYRYK